MRNCCSKYTYLFVGLLCISSGIVIFYQHFLLNGLIYPYNLANEGFLIYTPGCKIPFFEIYHESIKQFVSSKTIVSCHKRIPPLVDLFNFTILKINTSILKQYYHQDKVKCQYIGIYRDSNGVSDDQFRLDLNKVEFDKYVEVKTDFIHVECFIDPKILIFEKYFSVIIKKNTTEERCKDNLSLSLKSSPEIKERLSVLIVGIDSTSRLNMLRQCPKTHIFLKDIMKAIELKGLNKVGDNTFTNMVPMLTGEYVQDLPWDQSMKDKPFDSYNFLWKEFSKNGYRTLLAEDAPTISMFNYHKKGFFYQPTDYYFRPMALAMENSRFRKNSKYHCFGSKLETEFFLDWVHDFAVTFQNLLYFGFVFLSRLTHDDIALVATGDQVYYNFLQKLYYGNYLNNTVLIFLSDHGARFGNFRQTYIGKIEERLPMFYFVFPEWFKNKYPIIMENLRTNSLRLTTFFDVYATLKDFVKFNDVIINQPIKDWKRISLLREINEQRTCEMASISPHWCTCHEEKVIDINEINVQKAAAFLINEINNILKDKMNFCKNVTLDKIVAAMTNENLLKYYDGSGILNDLDERTFSFSSNTTAMTNYFISIISSPGGAMFEATIRFTEGKDVFQLMGDISRINSYGNQSICMDDAVLRKFCYCK